MSSSSHIPNLLSSLRAQRADAPRRGLRRVQPHAPEDDLPRAKDPDLTVQQTDIDAAGSRLSCVELGYLDDPFAKALAVNQQAVRRMPIINRGTYVRTVGIDRLVGQFLEEGKGRKQIISLGAGTDTRPFRLLQVRSNSQNGGLLYHEVDFEATTKKKADSIRLDKSIPTLLADGRVMFGAPQNEQKKPDNTSITSASYTLNTLDLRQLASNTPPPLPYIEPSLPTLILSECCLTYLSANTSSAILKHLLSLISPDCVAEVVLYEPIQPDDAFGRTMLANLASRDISMPGLEAFKSIEEHRERLKGCGFLRSEGWTISAEWDRQVSPDEKARLRRIEGLDEEEEWLLLAGHYALIRGVRDVVAR